jgi:hypothetical protein
VVAVVLAAVAGWVIPIIIAACLVAITAAIATIVASIPSFIRSIKNAVESAFIEYKSVGACSERSINAVTNAVYDKKVFAAMAVLGIAISILFLCLKPYMALGGWVMAEAITAVVTAIVVAWGLSPEEPQLPAVPDTESADVLLQSIRALLGLSSGPRTKDWEIVIHMFFYALGFSIALITLLFGLAKVAPMGTAIIGMTACILGLAIILHQAEKETTDLGLSCLGLILTTIGCILVVFRPVPGQPEFNKMAKSVAIITEVPAIGFVLKDIIYYTQKYPDP